MAAEPDHGPIASEGTGRRAVRRLDAGLRRNGHGAGAVGDLERQCDLDEAGLRECPQLAEGPGGERLAAAEAPGLAGRSGEEQMRTLLDEHPEPGLLELLQEGTRPVEAWWRRVVF